MNNKEITCFFTGHRDLPPERIEYITRRVENYVRKLYERGYRIFVCGGAVGFDQLCADAVLRLRAELDIRLHLVLPCEDQDRYFSQAQKELYTQTRRQADSVEVLYRAYTRGCMHARNRRMADMSAVCVTYCTKRTGGTAYTVKYAEDNGLKMVYIK